MCEPYIISFPLPPPTAFSNLTESIELCIHGPSLLQESLRPYTHAQEEKNKKLGVTENTISIFTLLYDILLLTLTQTFLNKRER